MPLATGAVTVLRRRLPGSASAAAALRCLRGDGRPFALIGAWAGGGAILGSEPVRVAAPGEDPFALLDELPALAPGPAVGGGWFGYLGYELRHGVEACQPAPFAESPGPPFALAFYDHVLRLDGAGAWWFEALRTDANRARLEQRQAALEARLADPPPPVPVETGGWRLRPGPAGHATLVAACRERIHAGDLFQANLCGRLDGRIDGDALDLFVAAAERLRPDRAAYLEGPYGAIASLSPELFLERRGRRVRTAPIKGTRPQGGRAELEASEKDRAENTMIVDLMRNDLGRVCEPGSIRVAALAQARPHTGVWHLVSEVEGRLRPEVGDRELLRATFPPGSVTGAPKVAAMDVISELESVPRGVYTGAIGFAGPGRLELSVAIRTFEVRRAEIRLGVGGGIVADSEPAAEAAELTAKAGPLLAAIGARLAPAAPAPTRAPLPRLGPRPLPRPDPATGVFETMLVRAGAVVALDRHLGRLATSLAALYGIELPDGLVAAVTAAGRRLGAGRLRLDVRRDGSTGLTTGPPAPATPVALRAWTVPGGLGPHKWIDRRLLEALEAASDGAMPLLVDADGLVLEASRASVFARAADGILRTPCADGRILPGVARARLLAEGAIEADLTLDDLRSAESVLVASALRGGVPVRGIVV